MTPIPKCTSWRGHKFEGRFSERPAGRIKFDWGWDPYWMTEVMKEHRVVTYERDICVRCGVTVERESSASESKTLANSGQ